MRILQKISAKFLVCTLVATLLVSGYLSVAHASVLEAPGETQIHLKVMGSSVEKAVGHEKSVDHKDGSNHHANGEPECHSTSCGPYSTNQNLQFNSPSLMAVAFSLLTHQRVKSLLAFLYRPPKSFV